MDDAKRILPDGEFSIDEDEFGKIVSRRTAVPVYR